MIRIASIGFVIETLSCVCNLSKLNVYAAVWLLHELTEQTTRILLKIQLKLMSNLQMLMIFQLWSQAKHARLVFQRYFPNAKIVILSGQYNERRHHHHWLVAMCNPYILFSPTYNVRKMTLITFERAQQPPAMDEFTTKQQWGWGGYQGLWYKFSHFGDVVSTA